MTTPYPTDAEFLPNRFGGVLRFVGAAADEAFWDRLWDELVASADYAPVERGHLPHQLRRTFRRWVKPGAHVLEAGCGLGHFTVATRALGYRTDGLDYAPRVVDRLKARYPDIPFVVGDVRRLDTVADRAYDAVYSPGVVEHFEDGPEAILAETHRILRPGGILLLSTPCFNVLLRAMHRLGGFRRRPTGAFFQYAFSERHMGALLASAGFDVVQVHQYGVIQTLTEHVRGTSFLLRLGKATKLVAAGLDSMPLVRRAGHTCIWVAEKRPA